MAKMEFMRGDGQTHLFVMPTTSWQAGGKLFFTAKPAVDDDNSDAKAVINQEFDDSVAVNDGTNVTYTCYFPPSATNSISTNGQDEVEYLGQFQWVSPTAVPSSFPGNNKYIDTVLYADIRRAVA